MNIFIYSESIKEENIDLVKGFLDLALKSKFNFAIYVKTSDELNRLNLKYDFKIIYDKKDLKDFSPNYTITLGGDGTILNAVRIIEEINTPILGVNMGRLGFLSSVEKGKMPNIIPALEQKNIKIEKRSLLQVESNIPIFNDAPYALNDFTLTKRDTSSMVTIHTYIDDKFLNSYWADGLIVSTPTGSTGYSLSCGGPIVFPESGNFIITPIAPHNLNVRPLIVSDKSVIRMEVEGRSENFLCTLDNRYQTVTSQHIITLRKNDFDIQLATLEGINFMKTIRNKLMWGLDKRN